MAIGLAVRQTTQPPGYRLAETESTFGLQNENRPRADSSMRLVVYDLVGACLLRRILCRRVTQTACSPVSVLSLTIASLIRGFGPHEVAERTGISLRHLQKLFTQRGSTCSEYIYVVHLRVDGPEGRAVATRCLRSPAPALRRWRPASGAVLQGRARNCGEPKSTLAACPLLRKRLQTLRPLVTRPQS